MKGNSFWFSGSFIESIKVVEPGDWLFMEFTVEIAESPQEKQIVEKNIN